ncbi:MAG: hypothetical protein J6W36_00135 [Clostridiales bacterium]|nr:hypothetical protein [Clostridiales bacterium]
MRRFKGITAALSLIMLSAVLFACHDPKTPTVVTSSTSVTTAQTTPSETSATTTSALTETTETAPSDSSETTALTTPSGTANTTAEIIHKANGKFNYVLKNKEWKFDGEMYYHKYKDGVVVYYDKETKAYFLIDSKGQGWYYDADLNDFVKDE